MGIAMTRELVPSRYDPSNQSRVPLRDPAKREERRNDLGLLKLQQNAFHVRFNPSRNPLPPRARDCVSECLDLKIVLHIHCHGVSDH
jgi:hypothetical protein